VRRALAVTALVAAVAPVAGAAGKTGFAFGRLGGSIRPYSVAIATDGVVRVSGPVQVGRRKLTRAELGALNRLAATNRFGALPKETNCAGTLPDVASTFIRVGPRTVRVHGSCVAGFARIWKALGRAVELSG
jgi:hypothetical protein